MSRWVMAAQVYTRHSTTDGIATCGFATGYSGKQAGNCCRLSLFSLQNEVISKQTSDGRTSRVMYGGECYMPNPE